MFPDSFSKQGETLHSLRNIKRRIFTVIALIEHRWENKKFNKLPGLNPTRHN